MSAERVLAAHDAEFERQFGTQRPSAGDDYDAKMEDARRFSPLLCKLVADRFGLAASEVSNLEMADVGAAVNRDLSGIDAVLAFPRGEATVAFRTRPEHDIYDVDFSLRTVSRDGETKSEWDKLKKSYQGDPYSGEIADYYAFARYDDARLVDVYLLRTEWLMDCIWGDVDSPEDEYPERASENGGKARYIPLADIDRAVVAKLS